jgi:hypothetical protein
VRTLSNLTLNGITMTLSAILKIFIPQTPVDTVALPVETSPLKTSSLKDLIPIEIGKQREKIKELKFKTEKLDNFIQQHNDLKILCEEEIQMHPEYIASNLKKPMNIGDTNENDLLTSLQCDAILLEHFLEERKRLIERCPKIFELFTIYVQKRDEEFQNEIYQKVKAIELKPNGLIEEISKMQNQNDLGRCHDDDSNT